MDTLVGLNVDVRDASMFNGAALLRRVWTRLGLFLCAFLCATGAEAVSPPPASVCDVPPAQNLPGSTPTQPGTWWNPQRYGTSWALMYQDNDTELSINWYTYDASGRPTWLFTTPATIQPDKTWSALLLRQTWNGVTQKPNAAMQAGEVAMRFIDGDPTRVALRWKWTEAGVTTHDECIQDFARPGPSDAPELEGDNLVTTDHVNTAFNGYWFEPTLPGYGLSLQMQQNTDVDPSSYSEAWGLTLYDDSGNPVWLLAKAPADAAPPDLDTSEVLTLEYSRAGAGYPNNLPTNDCTAADNCIVTHAAVGTLMRSFSSAAAGAAQINLSADHVGANALPQSYPEVTTFDRPAGAGTVAIQKLTAITQILVDRTQCQVPFGETYCTVTVNWAVDPGLGAIGVYRINLDAPNPPLLLSAFQYGESPQQIAAGERVRFEIRKGNQVLHQTPEIRGIGDPLADVPDATPTAPATLNAQLGAHSAQIGTAAGQASTDGGAAHYTIPIVAPPGRRGMQPQLSLAYNSRAGNGIAGMGWSLDGLSSIHRCPQTVAQDGRARAVTFDAAQDKLCLDGQRLVVVSGTYGNKNAVYATEIDSFVRVIQHGGTLNQTAVFFEARHKNGEVAWYGGVDLDDCASDCAAEALVGTTRPSVTPTEPDGTVQALALSWPIERRVDPLGNLVRYVYASFTPGELLLTDIYYTGKQSSAPKQSTDGNRRIQIGYAVRPTGAGINDAATTYLAGKVLRTPRRLALITTYVGSQKVRDYTPTYQISAGSGRSLLSALQECAYSTNVAKDCKPATAFAWDHGANKYQLRADARINAIADPAFSSMDGDFSTSVRFEAVGDFNGDGSREVLWKGPSSGDTPVPEQRLVSLQSDRSVAWSLVIPAEQVGTFGGLQTEFSGRADFDLDGRADLITLPKPAQNSTTRKIVLKYWHGPPTATTFNAAFTKTFDTGIVVEELRSIVFTGDMNGDGRADLVTQRQTPDKGAGCSVTLAVYLNLPGGTPATPQFVAQNDADLCLQGSPNPNGGFYSETLAKVADLSGDGLPDLWINDKANSTNGFVRVLVTTATASSSSWSKESAEAYFASPRSAQERRKDLFTLWMDANGDGLEDFVYINATGNAGEWALRLNIGRGFAAPVALSGGTALRRLGIEHCLTAGGGTGCNTLWHPWRAGLIRVMDTDGDGRDEILVPRAFAARVCTLHLPEPQQGQMCETNAQADAPSLGAPQPSVLPEDSCDLFYYCPEDPSDATITPATLTLKFDDNNDGIPNANVNGTARPAYYRAAGDWDRSAYFMASIEFAEYGHNALAMQSTNTDIVTNANSGWSSDDLYGDGLVDAPLKVACFNGKDEGDAPILRRCAIPWKDEGGITLPGVPLSLPNAIPLFTRQALLNENTGPSGQLSGDGKTPATPDMLVGISDGLGVTTTWEYYPLSSKAGRTAAQTPLYVPASTSGPAYVDAQHIYFTSTLPVVSTMTTSDGIGGTRVWRYGYKEAMYHQQGRGFQGFRTVIEEDVSAKVRSTSVFHQKFPLTGKLESRQTDFILASNAGGMTELTTYVWRCNRLDRGNATACENGSVGAGAFPYLDSATTRGYDPTIAEAGGASVQTRLRTETYAPATASSSCTVTFEGIAAGYDAYGNVTASTVEVWDRGPAAQLLLNKHCELTRSTYLTNPTPHIWWVDPLSTRHTQTRSVYTAQHAVPAGVSNPVRDLYTRYEWNPNRTLYSERVSADAVPTGTTSAPMTLTTYTYNSFGLPTLERTQTNNRQLDGTFLLQELRRTDTAYNPDGYFPQTLSRYVTANTAHSTTVITRARDGQPELSTDPNGLKTKMQYDAFGTLIATEYRNAADSANRLPIRRRAVAACAGCIGGALYKITEVQDGAPKTVTQHDLFGRLRRQETQLLDGTFARTDTTYDALGRTTAQTAPYRSGEPTHTSTTSYDLANRPTVQILPRNLTDKDGRNFGDLRLTTTYSGRRVDVTECGTQPSNNVPAPCRSTWRLADALDRPLQSTDAAGHTSRYWHDGANNPIAVQSVDATTTKATYNAFGHRTQIDDPNQGVWSFITNGLGELRHQKDARGIQTTFDYDRHGRLTQRRAQAHAAPTNAADVSLDTILDTYTWDPANAKGLPAGHARTVNNITERHQSLTYDAYSRPTETITTQATATQGPTDYHHRTVYDTNFGRPKAEAWPNNVARRIVYAANGEVQEERDPVENTLYRRIQAVDGRGQVTQETLGAITATRTYAPSTGQMLTVAYKTGTTKRRGQDYRYDLFGNLSRRVLDLGVNGLTDATAPTERYANDTLDRLTQAQRTAGATGTVTYAYTANGNLSTKSDYSLANGYSYGAIGKAAGGNAGPHAVRQVQRSAEAGNGTVNFAYDNNGNLTSISDPATPFAALYDHRNLPNYVQRGTATSRLFYGADDQRARQLGSDGEHVYLNNFEHVLQAGGSAPVETRAYLGYAVIARHNGTQTLDYLLTDRLGSIDAVANPAGTITEKRAYDAFGAPRNGTNWANLSPKRLQTLATTQQGYTAHEHLNSVELIHMNGRAYDYKVGRFLSVDPLITFPMNSQSLNPYSYVMNNPLSWTDPSGYAVCDADKSSCKAPANGETTKIKRSVPGSRIRQTVGTMTGTRNQVIGAGGAGAASAVSIHIGMSNLSNGANGQSTLGATRSDEAEEGSSELGTADGRLSGESENNGISAAHSYTFAATAHQENVFQVTAEGEPELYVDEASVNPQFRYRRGKGIDAQCHSSGCDINASFSVGADSTLSDLSFARAYDDLSYWNGNHLVGDMVYRINFSFSVDHVNPDIVLSATARNVGGYVSRLGRGRQIFLGNGFGAHTAAHEFGHLLGLGHRLNHTRSLMSYNFAYPRQVYSEDVSKLADMYGR